MTGAVESTKEDTIDPAVGEFLRSKWARRLTLAAFCAACITPPKTNLEEAAELIEDAFRISQQPIEERDLILEVVS